MECKVKTETKQWDVVAYLFKPSHWGGLGRWILCIVGQSSLWSQVPGQLAVHRETLSGLSKTSKQIKI